MGRGSSANLEEVSAKVRDWYLLARLLKLLGPYWISVLASLVCSLVSTLLQVLNPLILSVAIDVYFLNHAPKAGFLVNYLPGDSTRGITLLSAVYLRWRWPICAASCSSIFIGFPSAITM
jgi:ATP-binding cassette subfamily B protein